MANRGERVAGADIYYAILLQGNCVFLSGASLSYLCLAANANFPKGERGCCASLEEEDDNFAEREERERKREREVAVF